jgi:hypothetical protein
VPDFSQLPGDLGLKFVPGDECNVALNLQRSVVGYTFTSFIYQTTLGGSGGGLGSLASIGQTVTAPTIGITNASTGAMVIGLSENQTALLSPNQNYRWYLRWVAPGDITRTIISGSVTAVAP